MLPLRRRPAETGSREQANNQLSTGRTRESTAATLDFVVLETDRPTSQPCFPNFVSFDDAIFRDAARSGERLSRKLPAIQEILHKLHDLTSLPNDGQSQISMKISIRVPGTLGDPWPIYDAESDQ